MEDTLLINFMINLWKLEASFQMLNAVSGNANHFLCCRIIFVVKKLFQLKTKSFLCAEELLELSLSYLYNDKQIDFKHFQLSNIFGLGTRSAKINYDFLAFSSVNFHINSELSIFFFLALYLSTLLLYSFI